MKKRLASIFILIIILISFTACNTNADRPSIRFIYEDYLSSDYSFMSETSKYINERYQIIRQFPNITIQDRNNNNEMSLAVAEKEYDQIKYRLFEKGDDCYLFLDVWEKTQGYTNLIDGHVNSYIFFLGGNEITYQQTPDNAIPLLIKDKQLFSYNELEFLRIDMETGAEEVLYTLPFEGEYPPRANLENIEKDSNVYKTFIVHVNTDEITVQGIDYDLGGITEFCTIDIT